jgi:hypothetical protein
MEGGRSRPVFYLREWYESAKAIFVELSLNCQLTPKAETSISR